MEPSAPNEDLLLQCQRFRVEKARHQTPDGTWHQREVVRHPGSVVIVPMVTPDSVCLIRNFRVAVADWLVELPAGTLEPDEPLEETAYRELIEETGFTATTVRHLHSFYAAPGILDEYMRLFVAEGLTPGASAREAGELIENLIVDFDDALGMVFDGTIRDAKTIVGLLYWNQLRRQRS